MSADYVIWSGYQLKQEYFPQFMEALIGNIALTLGLNWGRALHHSVREYAPTFAVCAQHVLIPNRLPIQLPTLVSVSPIQKEGT